MNIVDICIIIFILFGAVLGFKRGFTKELVKALGFIIIIILSYLLKNPLSVYFYEHLPFLKIGILKGVEILNILVYEILAFLVVFVALSLILKAAIVASSLFEKILNATIILGIPSKIAGAIVGVIYHYVIVFVVLYVLSLMAIDNNSLANSNYREKIINNTPVLSGLIDKTISVTDEFKSVKDLYDDKSISESEFNYRAIEVFLKYDLVKSDSVYKLIDSGKIAPFDNYRELLEKYKGE